MRGEFNKAATAVVVDSSPLRLQLYKPLLAQWQVDVVAVSPTAERAADLAEVSGCQLLVVDAGESPDSRTLYRLLRRAHKRCPELISVVLVEDAEQVVVESALAAGACATVDRSTDMRQAARLVAEAFSAYRAMSAREGAGMPARTRLTRREIEILRLVAEGRSNREVGQLLWVTDQTVKFHLANAYRKLGVRNRFEASQWAVTRGLVKAGHVSIGGQRLRPAGSRG
jgi:DNA-binding NarL/FixJ family response regulator